MKKLSRKGLWLLMACALNICASSSCAEDDKPKQVSCYHLLTNSDTYLKTRVAVQGYMLSIENKLWLYPCKEDADFQNETTAIKLELPDAERNKLEVVKAGRINVSGVFSKMIKESHFMEKKEGFKISVSDLGDLKVALTAHEHKTESFIQGIGSLVGQIELLESLKKGEKPPTIEELREQLDQLMLIVLQQRLNDD